MDKICLCTNLTKCETKNIVDDKNISWEKLIKKTGASTYCGACYFDLKNNFFYYKYLKKICKSKNLLLFKNI